MVYGKYLFIFNWNYNIWLNCCLLQACETHSYGEVTEKFCYCTAHLCNPANPTARPGLSSLAVPLALYCCMYSSSVLYSLQQLLLYYTTVVYSIQQLLVTLYYRRTLYMLRLSLPPVLSKLTTTTTARHNYQLNRNNTKQVMSSSKTEMSLLKQEMAPLSLLQKWMTSLHFRSTSNPVSLGLDDVCTTVDLDLNSDNTKFGEHKVVLI